MEPILMGNEILTIDADTRTIEVPGDFLLGVETDNDAERVEFQCPKVVGDNLDLTQYHIYIHYQNAKGEKGKYLCDDIQDSGENITFSWLLSQKVVLYKGQTKFLVCAKKTQEDTIVWNTTLASGNVLEGLDVDEEIVQQNDDVIEQILLKLEQIESSGGTGDINNAKVTFTEAEERTNIESQETMSTTFGKIKKWFTDLKTVAFSGSYNDLSNKPTIPTKTSELTNDSDFLTAIPEEYVTNTELEEKDFAKTSDIPSKLPNPNKLIFTGAVTGEYDGGVEKTINIPEGGGELPEQTTIIKIFEYTLSSEEAMSVYYEFTSETYPDLEKYNEFLVEVYDVENKSEPYFEVSINDVSTGNNGGGNLGYHLTRISINRQMARVRHSAWVAVSFYDPNKGNSPKFSNNVGSYEILCDVNIGDTKIKKLRLSSYKEWLQEGAKISIYGWNI